MTVQTEVRPRIDRAGTRTIRGFRGWVVGLAALVAAGTGIGFGVASMGSTPAIVAPDSPQTDALKRLHAEGFEDPLAEARLEGLKRLHAEGAGVSVNAPTFSDAYRQLKDEGWES